MIVPVNLEVDPVTSVVQGSQEIFPGISAGQVSQVIGQGILVGRADRVTGPVTLAAQADLEILAGQVNQAETMFRTFPAASATERAGKIGETSIATISAIGGKTTLATSTIGLTTVGGMTATSTIPTILGLVSGPVRFGAG